MSITDVFIKRPVLATVVNLLILLFGAKSLMDLSVRQYPEIEDTVITVTTVYPGANSSLIQGFITDPVQKAIASADGVEYLSSESSESISIVSAHIKLNFDPDKAFTSVMSKVSEIKSQLPEEAQEPIIQTSTGNSIALMYLALNSDEMSSPQIVNYIDSVIAPQLETINGVAKAQIFGSGTFSMRLWLDPVKMVALNVNADDVYYALSKNNYMSAAGSTKGELIAFGIHAETDLHTVKQFENLVIRSAKDSIIRIRDVARVELGSKSYDSMVTFNGISAVFIGVSATPSANPLTVIADVRKEFSRLSEQFPSTLSGKVVYDATEFISASIEEVIHTIFEAGVIVVVVIFLFLGSLRSVVIPVVTIPLSLVGVCLLMAMMGYSINLLTLLAMVLAIGLVVDDAIVVVENIHRYIEEGLSPFDASIKGAGEIAIPVITMTVTLAAVYAPIAFLGGLTGALFKEFAFTLAAAVVISGIVALTLSPMMCSKVLRHDNTEGSFAHKIDIFFERVGSWYGSKLVNMLKFWPVYFSMAIVLLVTCYFLYISAFDELAPEEDQGALFIMGTGPEYSNIDYTIKYSKALNDIYSSIDGMSDYFIVNGLGAPNTMMSGLMLDTWAERDRSQREIKMELDKKIRTIPGLNLVSFPLPSLPGADGLPIQFVINTTSSNEVLQEVSAKIEEEARKSGLFIFVENTMKFNKPELSVDINRDKAAQLGISMSDIGTALAVLYGENYISRFSLEGKSYEVIPQVKHDFRKKAERINEIHVRTATGQMVPLSTIISLGTNTIPNKLTQFQQLNSTTIQGVPVPTVSMGQALAFLKEQAELNLPEGVDYDYTGQSRQFISEGSALVYTMLISLVVIYLVLAAQFESFMDPLIILVTVPLSICGALIPLALGFATINIYTQVGLLTLIGLISKHGILMVEYANAIKAEKRLSRIDAIIESAKIRLRPILMTTAAMVVGVLPLLIADGAGAASRHDIGLVIFSGMSIGTFFTLFIIPTCYISIPKLFSVPDENTTDNANSAP